MNSLFGQNSPLSNILNLQKNPSTHSSSLKNESQNSFVAGIMDMAKRRKQIQNAVSDASKKTKIPQGNYNKAISVGPIQPIVDRKQVKLNTRKKNIEGSTSSSWMRPTDSLDGNLLQQKPINMKFIKSKPNQHVEDTKYFYKEPEIQEYEPTMQSRLTATDFFKTFSSDTPLPKNNPLYSFPEPYVSQIRYLPAQIVSIEPYHPSEYPYSENPYSENPYQQQQSKIHQPPKTNPKTLQLGLQTDQQPKNNIIQTLDCKFTPQPPTIQPQQKADNNNLKQMQEEMKKLSKHLQQLQKQQQQTKNQLEEQKAKLEWLKQKFENGEINQKAYKEGCEGVQRNIDSLEKNIIFIKKVTTKVQNKSKKTSKKMKEKKKSKKKKRARLQPSGLNNQLSDNNLLSVSQNPITKSNISISAGSQSHIKQNQQTQQNDNTNPFALLTQLKPTSSSKSIKNSKKGLDFTSDHKINIDLSSNSDSILQSIEKSQYKIQVSPENQFLKNGQAKKYKAISKEEAERMKQQFQNQLEDKQSAYLKKIMESSISNLQQLAASSTSQLKKKLRIFDELIQQYSGSKNKNKLG